MRTYLIFSAALILFGCLRANAQIEWKIRSSGTAENIRSVKFAAGKFFASDGDLYVSVTGESWSKVALLPASNRGISTITPVAGGILAVGNGYYWPPSKTRAFFGGYTGGAMDSAYINGVAVITGIGDDASNKPSIGLYRDSTGKIVLISELPWIYQPYWVVATEDEFLVYVSVGIYASPDGMAWTLRSRSGASDKPFYSNGVLVSQDEYSADKGATWERWPEGRRPVPQVYRDGLYLAAGSGGLIATSPDGEAWTSRETGTTNTINSITFGNSAFVAVGAAGRIISSALPSYFPFPPAPKLTITPSVTIKWPSTAGLYYQPQFSTDMKNWMSFGGTIPGSGLDMSRSFDVTGQRQFFRVTVE